MRSDFNQINRHVTCFSQIDQIQCFIYGILVVFIHNEETTIKEKQYNRDF